MRKSLLTAFILFGSLSLLYFPAQATPVDSVGTVVLNGARFIRHQVAAKETIYSVARKYRVGVTKIQQANPGLKTLQVGQVILIPAAVSKSQKPNLTNAPAPKMNKVLVYGQPTGPALFDGQGNQVHKVDSKQTLFSIARQYGVSVPDLKKWNNLPDDNVHDNQTLVVKPAEKYSKPSMNAPVEPVNPVKPESGSMTTTPVIVARPESIRPVNPVNQNDDSAGTAAPRQTYSRVTESGLAEVISAGKPGNKYLALHKTAPVGSFITVRNLMNNQTVSVRVIGKLPDIGTNEKVVVKISKRAFQRLGAIDNRFLVEVQYEVSEKILSSNQ